MSWKTIFKREKPIQAQMPSPQFGDNWKQDKYEQNLAEGVKSLQEGKSIQIYDDGRGYELAIEIKKNFLLEYQKQLAEKVNIDSTCGTIKITINP